MSSPVLNVRPSRLDEAELLPAIERSAGQAFQAIPELAWVATDDTLPAEAHRHIVEPGGSWVAEVDGGVVGFAGAEPYGDDRHVWEVAVAHESQGRGAGTALIDAVITHARRHRLRRVTPTTFRDVPWNEGLDRRLGFRVLERTELDPRLSYVLDLEARQGLPREHRCTMALPLASP